MEYKVESTLERFDAWSGGKDTLEVLIRKGDCEEVESLLEDLLGEIPTETEINDVLWFERDMIAEHLGYKDWEAYEEGYSLSDVEDADEWFSDIDDNDVLEKISGMKLSDYDDEDDFVDDVADWWDELDDKRKVEIYYDQEG